MNRNALITLSVVAASLMIGQAQGAEGTARRGYDEQVIKQLEQEWAEALVKRDQAVIDLITASDWMLTDPEGSLVTKAQADADLKSRVLKFESYKLDELKVRVYGDSAVVHGLDTERSSYKGKDTTGQYRFTDVFVKRNGRWQAIATHATRVVKP